MSLMIFGAKMTTLKKGIENGRFTTRNQVKKAAMDMDIAVTIGYVDLSPEDKDRWYEQLAVNVFENHNNCIPCFVDLGFGRELLGHSFGKWNGHVPKKQRWKI